MPSRPIVKAYFDYKSPYAYIAFEPALELISEHDIELRWMPYLLRIKGKGERSIYSEWKVRYSYQDARRLANRRGGVLIRGPRKVYDSTASLLGGLYAAEQGAFVKYSREVFARFFEHRLEIDSMEEVTALIEELGFNAHAFAEFAVTRGAKLLDEAIKSGEEDHVFGVPTFVFEGEQFWGGDRIWLLKERLQAHSTSAKAHT
ncbi:MAG: DsbA family protein [Gammaproteobacteria bacterium]|nr:DsbA family protein [Gammaproteobacteria bacterium]MCY4200104.1 DsbA family protein [Gammaproteobacteria bacterium]MCY4278027.1 DsbA family protein [Gammaproteobacteria bacterium]MCY4322172.1 DsbA family protein [Gammaproteobacteria bacterium]